MQQELTSEGKCLFCNRVFTQGGIGKHLSGHLSKMVKEDSGKKQVNYCHVEVKAGEMFLHLLVKGNLTMVRIDRFLRQIWLDCCGHLSDFGHKKYEVSMTDRVEDVFKPRVKLFHDYDYGTTTRVFLSARRHYSLNLSEDIILLSRNEPLKLLCASSRHSYLLGL